MFILVELMEWAVDAGEAEQSLSGFICSVDELWWLREGPVILVKLYLKGINLFQTEHTCNSIPMCTLKPSNSSGKPHIHREFLAWKVSSTLYIQHRLIVYKRL